MTRLFWVIKNFYEFTIQPKTNKMRVTHTPFKTRTRAIGSDLEMTLALLGALRGQKQSRIGKLGKITTTLTKLFK